MKQGGQSKDSSPSRTRAESELSNSHKDSGKGKKEQSVGQENQGGNTSVGNAASTARSKGSIRKRSKTPASRNKRRARRADIHPLDRAIRELRNELARSPNNALLYGRLGALQYRRGDLQEAQVSYRKAIEIQPSRAAFQNNLGNILCDRGQMKEGIGCYETAIALEQAAHPTKEISEESSVNLELARLEYRLIHERIEYLEKASNLDVASAEALNALGGGYILCQKREKALATFRRASEMDPLNQHAARNIAFAHVIDMSAPFDLSDAMAEVAALTARFPQEARLFIHEGELFEAAGLLESSEEKYTRALKADPRLLEAYDLLGKLREALGMQGIEDETARHVHAALAKLTGNSTPRKNEKIGLSERLDQIFAKIAEARFERLPLDDTRLLEADLACILSETALEPQDNKELTVQAALLLIQLQENDGRRSQAVATLKRTCEQHPQHARLWFEQGGMAYRSGEIALAVEAFEQATLLDPQEGFAYQSLRFAFDGFRRYRTERVRFEAAVQSNPGDALAHHHLGMAAMSVLKDDEALFHFKRALDLDPHLAEAACGCARALQRQGHWSESEAMLRRALQVDPDFQEAQIALKQLEFRKEQKKSFQDPSTTSRS